MNENTNYFGIDISKAICNYGLTQEVPLYNALTDVQSECLQLFRLMDNFLKK